MTVALETAWSGTALAYTALTTAWTGSQWLQEDFVGTAGQSTFTLAQTPQTVFVYINGMVQPVADYSTAAQTVVLVSGTVDETIFHNSQVKPDYFLAKPYPAKQLAEMVKSLVSK